MASVKIRVGAALDADINNVFRPLIDAAKRARQTIASDAKKSDSDQTKAALAGIKEQSRAAMAAARDQYREGSRLNRDMYKGANELAKENARAASNEQREKIRADLRLKLDAIRTAAKAEQDANKSTARSSGGGGGGGGGGLGGYRDYMASHRMIGAAGRGLSGAVRMGAGFAGSMARGAGFDLDVGASMGRNVSRETMLTDLANSAYQVGGKGQAGIRQNTGAISDDVNKVSNNNALDPTKVIAGLQGFTAITGDLETGRKVMGDLARLSKATGTDFEDMANAAGNASTQLADTPDKAEKLQGIMRSIAGQGKLGAVEIKDMAVRMAQLAAAAPQFKGEVSDNIVMMGVLAQEARQHGGAPNAAGATTAVGGFMNTFRKGARMKEFTKLGIDPTNLSPQEIIVESLRKTKGNNVAMGKLFMDKQARTAVAGFENIYKGAGGGEKGIAAVEAEFERLKNVAMGRGEIEESAAKAIETTASKAQLFQNALDETSKSMQAQLLPTLLSLQGPALGVMKAFGGVAEFAANNPFVAIGAVMGGSVVKSAVGEMAARAFAGGVGNAAGGLAGGVGAGGAALLGSAALATVAILSLAAAADQAGKLWKETHEETSYAAGTTEEQKKRLAGMTREEKQGELASLTNKGALKAAGYLTDNSEFSGPINPNVANAVDPKVLEKLNADQLKTLQGELKVRIVNVDEINQSSGDRPPVLNNDGVMPPPPSFKRANPFG